MDILAEYKGDLYGACASANVYKIDKNLADCTPLDIKVQVAQAVSKVSAIMSKFNAAASSAQPQKEQSPIIQMGVYND